MLLTYCILDCPAWLLSLGVFLFLSEEETELEGWIWGQGKVRGGSRWSAGIGNCCWDKRRIYFQFFKNEKKIYSSRFNSFTVSEMNIKSNMIADNHFNIISIHVWWLVRLERNTSVWEGYIHFDPKEDIDFPALLPWERIAQFGTRLVATKS